MSLQCELCGVEFKVVYPTVVKASKPSLEGRMFTSFPAPSENATRLGKARSYCCSTCSPYLETLLKVMFLERGNMAIQESTRRIEKIDKNCTEKIEQEQIKRAEITNLMCYIMDTPFAEFTKETVREIKLKYPYTLASTLLLEDAVEVIKKREKDKQDRSNEAAV